MRLWLIAVAVGSIAMVVLIAVTSGSHKSTAERFDKAFDEGAPCHRLFEIRNELDPKDPLIYEMNSRLRSVRCYGSASERAEP
jgi:hypothetical protein